jgi:hypothetical protein
MLTAAPKEIQLPLSEVLLLLSHLVCGDKTLRWKLKPCFLFFLVLQLEVNTQHNSSLGFVFLFYFLRQADTKELTSSSKFSGSCVYTLQTHLTSLTVLVLEKSWMRLIFTVLFHL